MIFIKKKMYICKDRTSERMKLLTTDPIFVVLLHASVKNEEILCQVGILCMNSRTYL
jgi:hypothetical protein